MTVKVECALKERNGWQILRTSGVNFSVFPGEAPRQEAVKREFAQNHGLSVLCAAMAEDNVEKFLSEQRSMEERKQALIAELLKQREGVIKDFDEKLAKLGYQAKDGKPKRSHHKPTPPADPKAKTKA